MYETSGRASFTALACVEMVSNVVMDKDTRAGAASMSNLKRQKSHSTSAHSAVLLPKVEPRYHDYQSCRNICLQNMMHDLALNDKISSDTTPNTWNTVSDLWYDQEWIIEDYGTYQDDWPKQSVR